MAQDASRRTFLGGLAAVATVGLLTRPRTSHAGEPVEMSPEERYLWRMTRGVDLGEPFYGDWYLVDAYPPVAGGLTLVVAKGVEGKPLRVDVVRRSEPPRAPAYTEHLELYTMDGGGGVKVLPDDLVDALQSLARQLQDNEAQGQLARFLMTHKQRVDAFPAFMERAAVELAPTKPMP